MISLIRAALQCVARIACLFIVATSATAQPAYLGEETCGSLSFGYGPFDYRVATAESKWLVESTHFTRDLELRFKPISERRMDVANDMEYTLRAFPNHPRALMAMMKYSDRVKMDPPRGSSLRVECYFERAIRFRSDDGAVRLVYGIFLTRKSREKEAVQQLLTAERLAPKGLDPSFHYNLGLAFFDVDDFERSLAHAHIAYEQGFPLAGLKNKLERAGKWRDSPPPAKAAAQPPAASAEPAKQ